MKATQNSDRKVTESSNMKAAESFNRKSSELSNRKGTESSDMKAVEKSSRKAAKISKSVRLESKSRGKMMGLRHLARAKHEQDHNTARAKHEQDHSNNETNDDDERVGATDDATTLSTHANHGEGAAVNGQKRVRVDSVSVNNSGARATSTRDKREGVGDPNSGQKATAVSSACLKSDAKKTVACGEWNGEDASSGLDTHGGDAAWEDTDDVCGERESGHALCNVEEHRTESSGAAHNQSKHVVPERSRNSDSEASGANMNADSDVAVHVGTRPKLLDITLVIQTFRDPAGPSRCWVYVCMYVCMGVCMYVWIYVCMYVCMYVCVYHACDSTV
jgi:hypothetical protein